jgi:hypothetical protein
MHVCVREREKEREREREREGGREGEREYNRSSMGTHIYSFHTSSTSIL